MSLSAAQAANAQNREALIVCRLFPAACTTHLETRLNWATAAAGKLVAGVGWSQLVGLALCVAIGLRARRATASRPVRSRLAQYWLGGSRPANAFLAFKIFLAALLYLEWLGLTAPEQDIMATPELMALVKKRPPWSYESYSSFQLYFTDIILARFLPCGTGGEFRVGAWVRFLARVRGMVVGCWACFLLWPHPALYAIGAIGYVYLGLIGLMYNPAHSTLAPMLFVLLATVAVVGLASGDAGAEAWLRRVLLEVVLAPAYLFSGVSKMRYMGRAFFGGEWLRTELHDGPRVSIPALLPWLRDTPGACEFLSFGNVLLEFVLPCVLVVAARRDDINSRRFVHGFLFVALGFHVTIFLLMGIVSASSSLHRRRRML